MSQNETTAPTASRKQVRKEIGDKLAGALAEYKKELGEKKLATHVKKVSKLISRDLVKISKKQRQEKKKKAPKKAAKATAKKSTKANVKASDKSSVHTAEANHQ
jgi:hypothetical protein